MPLIPEEQPQESLAASVGRRTPLPRAGHPAPPRTPVTAPAVTPVPLEEVLLTRRSVREFTDRPVASAVLGAVLDTAEAAQRTQWPAGEHGDAELEPLLLVRRVEGLAPGVFGRQRGEFVARPGAGAHSAELAREYADAAVLVLVLGPVARAEDTAYGGLLVRAGALGHAIWLASRTHGLDCSVYGRAYHGAGGLLSGSDTGRGSGPRQRHLFTVALGHAAGSGR